MNSNFFKTNISSNLLSLGSIVGQGIRFSKFYFYHLAVIFSLRSFFLKLKRKEIIITIHHVYFILWPFITLFWTPDWKMGFVETVQVALGFYLILFNPDHEKLKKMVVVVIGINLLVSVGESLGLFQYIYSQPASHGPTGLQWNTNNNAFFILIFSPIVFHSLKRYLGVLYLVISSIIIYLATSKLIIIGWVIFLTVTAFKELKRKRVLFLTIVLLIIGSCLFLVQEKNNNSDRYQKYSLTIPIISRSLVLIPSIIKLKLRGEVVEFDYSKTDASLHERLILLDGVIDVIIKNFWFGLGAGGLGTVHNKQANIELILATPHCYFLEIWAKYGVFYLIEYLLILTILLKKLFKKNNYCFMALLFFIIFNPVISTAIYFLPKWALYRYSLNEAQLKA